MDNEFTADDGGLLKLDVVEEDRAETSGRWPVQIERGSWRKSLQVGAGSKEGVGTSGGCGKCRGGAWRAEVVDGWDAEACQFVRGWYVMFEEHWRHWSCEGLGHCLSPKPLQPTHDLEGSGSFLRPPTIYVDTGDQLATKDPVDLDSGIDYGVGKRVVRRSDESGDTSRYACRRGCRSHLLAGLGKRRSAIIPEPAAHVDEEDGHADNSKYSSDDGNVHHTVRDLVDVPVDGPVAAEIADLAIRIVQTFDLLTMLL
ncbi:hypothetical protein Syun_002242 [Stephania yunnanensis]|uniref:Uncharacterized protein n=1 Tax=Stephania yunnanensis TaxID=152371 RepID=A0AAP0LH71_9MAGN